MKTIVVVQARMGSSRLPGKVMKTVLGRPLLEYQLERLRKMRRAEEIIVATTDNGSEAPIVDLCKTMSIPFYCGSEEDVLQRYHETSKEFGGDVIVRVTSDCPLIDPAVVDEAVKIYHGEGGRYDYVSNTLERTYPRGMDTEVFSFEALREAYENARDQYEREHVTPFMYRRPERFRLGSLKYGKNLSRHRWTVDTVEDFELIRRILEALHPRESEFSMDDVLGVLELHPDWPCLNIHGTQ